MPWGHASLANVACRTIFGEAATVGGTTCRAVFDQAYQEVVLQGEVPIASTSPVLDVVLADLPSVPVQGDVVVVDSGTWEVSRVVPDGQGNAKLFLYAT